LYKSYKKKPTLGNKNKYICYRTRLKTVLNRAERDYYRNKFKLLAGNLTQTWKLLNNVLNKNRPSAIVDSFVNDEITITNPNDIVEYFNDFFCNIGQDLAAFIPASSGHFSSYLDKSYLN